MERVQHIAQTPGQLEWMRNQMAIAPLAPEQNAAEWLMQRIQLARGLPNPVLPQPPLKQEIGVDHQSVPRQQPAQEQQSKPEPNVEKTEIKEEPGPAWNVGMGMDFDGFYNQNNTNHWANNDTAAHDIAAWEHANGRGLATGADVVKDEYEGPVSTLTAPHAYPLQNIAAPMPHISNSNEYASASLNPALLHSTQYQPPRPNTLKRKASPTAPDSSAIRGPMISAIDVPVVQGQTTAADPSNVIPRPPSPSREKPAKASPPPAPAYDLAAVKALLTAANLRLHETPRKLMRLLLDNPKHPKRPFIPKPRELVELLKIIRTGGRSFFDGLGAELELLKLFGGWYKLALKEPEVWDGILPPLLQVISRTPISINNLIESKLGMYLKKKLPENASEDLKRKRAEAFEHCEKLVADEQQRTAKKPRPDPAAAGPSKPIARPVVKPAPKPVATSTDMSFFGAEKQALKPKPLPSFKKVAKPPVAASSTGNAFANTLGQLSSAAAAKPRSPVVIEPLAAGGKVKKRVRFRDAMGGLIADVKEFKQEAYEFGGEIDLHGMSSHDMDMEEGKALRVHGVEEVIDWYGPEAYVIAEPVERGTQSGERTIQDDRERTVLAITYHNLAEIPPCADESQVNVVGEDPASVGSFLLPQDWPTNAIAPLAPAVASQNSNPLADLLARIQASGPIAPVQSLGPGFSLVPPPPQQQPQQQQYGAYPIQAVANNAWGLQSQQQQQSQHLASDHGADRGPMYGKVRGGGVAGGGSMRGSRTLPCRNFMSPAGCRFGDECHYAHNEPPRWY